MKLLKIVQPSLAATLPAVGRWMWQKLSRQLIPNIGTLVLMALLLSAYHAWAAPQAAPPAQGATTGLLSYQGYLTDAGGTPLDGEVGITFRLYSAPTGGSALWSETHTGGNAVPVSDGLFNVMLGSLTPIPSNVWASGAAYLGVQVGDDSEMTPREVVGNVPTALGVSDGAITSNMLAPGAAGGWTFFEDNVAVVTLDGITNTGDPPWEAVDVSAHVPSLATAVLVSVQNTADGTYPMVQVRPVGSAGGGGQFWTTVWHAGIWDSATGIVKLDATHSFQWRARATGCTITAGRISLWGYYEPAP